MTTALRKTPGLFLLQKVMDICRIWHYAISDICQIGSLCQNYFLIDNIAAEPLAGFC